MQILPFNLNYCDAIITKVNIIFFFFFSNVTERNVKHCILQLCNYATVWRTPEGDRGIEKRKEQKIKIKIKIAVHIASGNIHSGGKDLES